MLIRNRLPAGPEAHKYLKVMALFQSVKISENIAKMFFNTLNTKIKNTEKPIVLKKKLMKTPYLFYL